jgi:hypothetical protein
MRIEVSFKANDIEYSIFTGNEDVLTDEAKLRALIAKDAE